MNSLILRNIFLKNIIAKQKQLLNKHRINSNKNKNKNKIITMRDVPTSNPDINYLPGIAQKVNSNIVQLLSCCTTIYSRYGNNQFLGSGSFIAPNIVLTAGHVVINSTRNQLASPVYVTDPNTNEYITVNTIYIDNVADIALLYIGKNVTNYLSLSPNNALIGDTVYVCGNPLGLDGLSVSMGIVRDNEYVDTAGSLLQNCLLLDNAGYSGNSGSPIVNANNQIVGIYTFGFKNTDQLGGGSNLDVLKVSINYMLTNRSNYISKNYIGLGYTVPTPFKLSAMYNSNQFSNQGLLINTVDTNSPFKGIINVNDVLLTINGIAMGALINQINFSKFIYGQNNITVTITYFSNSTKTIKTANVLLNKTYSNVAVTIDTPFNPLDIEINNGINQKFKLK